MPASLAPDTPARRLLDWYDRERRDLPWRKPPGIRADPYAVWLSEIMLQQTTVATVRGYFDAFMARWPRVMDLASAPLDDVLHAWQGLGYYARARNLHRCAQTVAQDYGGTFPASEAGLLDLPGIGPYTAAAIAAIAFDIPATIVDGNVERVITRLHRLKTPLPDAKPHIRDLAAALTPQQRAGDYAQAIMDLGATICTPRSPRCMLCPWSESCAARRHGDAASYPVKRAKPARPTRHAIAFWITREDGGVLLRRRAESGLLGGLMEIPSTPWIEGEAWSASKALQHSPMPSAEGRLLSGDVIHVFTHFRLETRIIRQNAPGHFAPPDGLWVHPRDFHTQALPTLMKKIARHAMAG